MMEENNLNTNTINNNDSWIIFPSYLRDGPFDIPSDSEEEIENDCTYYLCSYDSSPIIWKIAHNSTINEKE